MALTAKEAFAQRLVEAMLDHGYRTSRNAKSGVDVTPLAKAAKVTREMARRYTEGAAVPDLNRLKTIAEWLGVRLPWLRDGEGPKRLSTPSLLQQPGVEYDALGKEAREVAIAWTKLSPETRAVMRDILFMLALAQNRFPWLWRVRSSGETYEQWEGRQEQNFASMSQIEADRKARVK